MATQVRAVSLAPIVTTPVPLRSTATVSPDRVAFIDLARVLAIVWMVYGHTINAVLAMEYRVGAWYDVWQFQRGLTAPLFLLVAGLAFSMATRRHWSAPRRPGGALRRIRRFLLLIVVGYALHFPVSRFAELAGASEERWQSFLAVDVLQLVGVTFLVLQLLAAMTPSRRVFGAACAGLAAAVLVVTPGAWSLDWPGAGVPLGAAAYLSPAVGSPFPLFPWAAYPLIGVMLGRVVSERSHPWGVAAILALAGLGLFVIGRGLEAAIAVDPAALEAHRHIPAGVLWRTGACLVILATLAAASRLVRRVPAAIAMVARESFLIYVAHLVLVYGSVWSSGLYQIVGRTLSPSMTAATAAVMVGAMLLLAWHWHAFRRTRPGIARVVLAVLVSVLVYRLL